MIASVTGVAQVRCSHVALSISKVHKPLAHPLASNTLYGCILCSVVRCSHCIVCFPLASTIVHTTSSGPSLTPSQSPSIPLSGNPVVPTTSVGSSTHSVIPIREYTILMCIVSTAVSAHLTMCLVVTFSGSVLSCVCVALSTFLLQAQVPTQHHPGHAVFTPVMSLLSKTTISCLLPFLLWQCCWWWS